jgi:hypothetical protein
MVEFQFSVIVNRSVEEVFSYPTNVDRIAEWQSMLLKARQTTPGPVEVGTTIQDVRKFLGRRLESTVEVTAYEANKSFELLRSVWPDPGDDVLQIGLPYIRNNQHHSAWPRPAWRLLQARGTTGGSPSRTPLASGFRDSQDLVEARSS